MTGEITLSGLVLPVGGIREKALAARRHGIKTFILPARNEPDLAELPPEVKTDMTFVPVKTLEEVLQVALPAPVALTIAFYISGHGLGHASRDVELIDEILPAARRRADRRAHERRALDLRRASAARRSRCSRCETDTGVVQLDSLRLDVEETARCAAAFYRRLRSPGRPPRPHTSASSARVSSSVTCRRWRSRPRRPQACHRCWSPTSPGTGSTRTTPNSRRSRRASSTRSPRAYSSAAKALRLPIWGGFDSVRAVTEDVPFIARRSTRDPADSRRALGVDRGQRLVLSSFSGYGLALPYDRIAQSGLIVVSPERHPPSGFKYEDLVAAADVVVSKPGYGIVSECVANRTPLPVHVARTLRRIRGDAGGDAANVALPPHRAGRPAGRQLAVTQSRRCSRRRSRPSGRVSTARLSSRPRSSGWRAGLHKVRLQLLPTP